MTTLEAALADTSKLGSFDGRDVVRTTIKVTRAGDGLSEALSIEPEEFDLGATVHVVLQCTVAKLTFEPIKDSTELSRVHTLQAVGATIVDGDLVREALDDQAERILRAHEQAKGIERIPFEDDDEFFDIEKEIAGDDNGG